MGQRIVNSDVVISRLPQIHRCRNVTIDYVAEGLRAGELLSYNHQIVLVSNHQRKLRWQN